MGWYVVGTAVICGCFGFASIHHLNAWWHARSNRVQLLFAICAAQVAIQLLALIAIGSTHDIDSCQRALDIRTVNGVLLCATIAWMYHSLCGFPSRTFVIWFTTIMLLVSVANVIGYRINGTIIAINRVMLGGEELSVPVRSTPGVLVVPIYGLLIIMQILSLWGAIRLIIFDRVLGSLLIIAGVAFIATAVSGISTDYLLKRMPYFGQIAWLAWLMPMYWLTTRNLRLQAKQQLDNEQRLAKLFKTSPDAICITRVSDGTIIEVNPAFERVFGWTRAESIGHSTMEIGVWQSQSARNDFVLQLRRNGAVRDFDFSFRRKNGALGFGLVSATLVEVDGLPCIQVVTRDLTDRQRFEEERRRTEQLSSLGLLASGVGHDFNNVLTDIVSSSEHIRTSPDAQIKAWADRIIDASNHARKLISSLLQFAQRSSVKARVFDAHEAVRTVTTVFAASGRGIEIDIAGLTAARSRVCGYEASIQNAVLNLCLNARDAMPDGGKITISSALEQLDAATCENVKHCSIPPGQYWRLCVADTGVGMDAATLSHCFEPHFTTKGETRAGLGLASVHTAVVEHRGAVHVESSPGNGAVFTLWLPLATDVMNTQWSLPSHVIVSEEHPAQVG